MITGEKGVRNWYVRTGITDEWHIRSRISGEAKHRDHRRGGMNDGLHDDTKGKAKETIPMETSVNGNDYRSINVICLDARGINSTAI